jgi:hypothetical protein
MFAMLSLSILDQSWNQHSSRHQPALVTKVFAAHELKLVNYCRLYLQVFSLSDMCNAEGTALAEGIRKGHLSKSQSYSLLEEPYQERPNEVAWGIWRRFLCTFCYDKDKLNRPLGPWFAQISTRRRWPNYYVPDLDLLHCQDAEYKYLTYRRLRFRVFSSTPVEDPEDPVGVYFPVPIDIHHLADGIRISRYVQDEWPATATTVESVSFEMLPDHECLLLTDFSFVHGGAHETCEKISNLGDVILVSWRS